MRILQVTNGYPPHAHGGVETYTHMIGHALRERGHAVEVFCRVSAPHEPEYALHLDEVEGIPVRRLVNDLTGASRFEAHYRNPRFDSAFRQHARAFRPEVVHFQHVLGLSATLLEVAAVLGLPSIVTLHDFWFFCPRATLFAAGREICAGPLGEVDCVRCLGGVKLGWGGALQQLPLYKWLLFRMPKRLNTGLRARLDRPTSVLPERPEELQSHRQQMQARTDYLFGLLRQAGQRVTPSHFVKGRYVAHGLEAELIDVLPLGIEPPQLRRAASLPRGRPVIAYIGTLHHHKGLDILIRAFRAAGQLSAQLHIYGAGDPQDVFVESLRTLAQGDERIHFAGTFRRTELSEILAGVDLLVLPSRIYETYSLAAREALLAGVPVVASDLGALPEVVHDGVNGYLVPPGDVPALARALERSVARLPELQTGTRSVAAAPTLAEHVTQLEQRYAQLVRQLARRSGIKRGLNEALC